MGRQTGNRADLSVGLVWKFGGENERKEKKKNKRQRLQRCFIPLIIHAVRDTHSISLSEIILVWSASSLLRLLKLKSLKFRKIALWSSGCEARQITSREHWGFGFWFDENCHRRRCILFTERLEQSGWVSHPNREAEAYGCENLFGRRCVWSSRYRLWVHRKKRCSVIFVFWVKQFKTAVKYGTDSRDALLSEETMWKMKPTLN